MPIHQCARFNNNPKLSHERAAIRMCRYLLSTHEKGLIYNPDLSKGLQCFVDTNFACGWTQACALSPDKVMSHTGYVIKYAGYPILWCSKLQTKIALSTTEAAYIVLSQAMREVLPQMMIMKEGSNVVKTNASKPEFYCQVLRITRAASQ